MPPEFNAKLAESFEQVLVHVRENSWDAFSEAAAATGLDPYTALSRLLVRGVEEELAQLFNTEQ